LKIIGFLQIRNEVSTGHLDRFIKHNLELFDKLYVYDDASTDGTTEAISRHATVLVRGGESKFSSELTNKAELLEKIISSCDEGDAILWLDADEVIYASKDELVELIKESFGLGYDSVALEHRNLWRSNSWYRVDHNFNDLRPARVWRVSKALSFPKRFGLHVTTEPLGLKATRQVNRYPVVHFGFASTDLILRKYENYRQHWLNGYALNRLISEFGLSLKPLSDEEAHLGSRFSKLHAEGFEEFPPQRLSALQWATRARALEEEFEQKAQKADVTLVSLIYKDLEWLEFQYSQLLKLQTDLPMGKADILFIANDATPEVLAFLRENGIPHKAISTRVGADEWFINSVYRAYNSAVEFSKTDYVYLVNSDMAYTKGTLARLYERRDPNLMLASRLVELGVLESGLYGIERSFGSKPKTFRQKDFNNYASTISTPEIRDGGLYMPLLVHRETFLRLGGFPEGNPTPESLEEYVSGNRPKIAVQGATSIPGDRAFVLRAEKVSVFHKTAFDSIAYHFQAGERRSNSGKKQKPSGYAVINDTLTGINHERVLWQILVERLKNSGVKVLSVSAKFPVGRIGSLINPLRLWINSAEAFRKRGQPRVTFSNASYALSAPGPSRKVVFRQDNPADLLNKLIQKNNLARADSILANDPTFVDQENRRNIRWIPVPLAEQWWTLEESTTSESKSKRVIFVGSFSETKGWPNLLALVNTREDIEWTLVSKYADDEHGLGSPNGKNWGVSRQIPQDKLKVMVANSDLLIVASPYETQCLAALEALSQNTPVLTTPTGFLGGYPLGKHEFGIVSDDLHRDIDLALSSLGEFQPRNFLEKLNLVGDQAWEAWDKILRTELEWSFRDLGEQSAIASFVDRAISFGVEQVRFVYRRRLKPALLMTYRRLSSR
jgi:glycosyltransferase involved in cell wall biosynthesis